jgi:UDP-glucose 4-epimerase
MTWWTTPGPQPVRWEIPPTLGTILVTGGAGFIGSHTVVELLAVGHEVVVLDNFCNAKREVLARLERIVGRPVPCREGDVRDRELLERIFTQHGIGAVIHFAGLKSVRESAERPLAYFQNNLAGTLQLLEVMQARGCRNLVFSSSATVYGDPHAVPVREDFPLAATNPYGRTKTMIEDLCRDVAASETGWHIALLRYFNPVGAHSSGLIGDDPNGTPNNLMPYLLQVASGQLERLTIFGSDYPTPDGTGVRDYIHVVDLARGHLAALAALPGLGGAVPVNLGTGHGFSVMEMVQAMSREVGRPLPFTLAPRRQGDVACCYADPTRAKALLGWQAEYNLADMCRDGWKWKTQGSRMPLGDTRAQVDQPAQIAAHQNITNKMII